MKSACAFALVVAVASEFSATASQVITTQDFINAAAEALDVDDAEALQLSSVAEQQKLHDYSVMWDSANSLPRPSTSSNSTVARNTSHEPVLQIYASSGTKAKLGGSGVSGDAVMRADSAQNNVTGRTGSVPSGDPTYDTWKLKLEKSLLHAVSRATTTRNELLATSPDSALHVTRFDFKESEPKGTTGTAVVVGTRISDATLPVRALAKISSNRTSVGSLVGSMATAIKDSTRELKRQQVEAKRQEAEARRKLDEAKRDQAQAEREQEEAKHERLEARHMLAKAKRAADAAFAASKVSSSHARSQLRPRRPNEQRREHVYHASDSSIEPETTIAGPAAHNVGDATVSVGKIPEQHPQHTQPEPSTQPEQPTQRRSRTSSRQGRAWKMSGIGEWRPSGASTSAYHVVSQEGVQEQDETSSEILLNAELAMRLGAQAKHAGDVNAADDSSLNGGSAAKLLSRVDAFVGALRGAAAL